ncbi:aspartic peptidase domain-containing protein, partial [Abortiporus biennis]
MSPLSSFSTSYSPRRWKGKARASLDQRDDKDDDGGEEGTILPLTLVGNTAYDAVYTIPITLGTSKTKKQTFSVQVDTGSSDLWLASNTCKTDACGQANGHLYDPSTSRSTGQSFQVGYVEGSVSGPIVWDTVEIGGYSIDNQAIGAANQVAAEPLSSLFSGILGLALPLNSEISQQVPAAVDNTPDGAAFTSNLFGLTPVSSAPGARFLSMTLERPESNKIPSLLGIGKHPTEDVPAINPTKIGYSSLVTTGSSGALFWKVGVTAITVYVDGVRKPVTIQSNTASGLGLGTGGGMSSVGTGTAVVDSGMPIILASRSITNGIYGALGVSPAADGNYYLPCTTPINMTVTLDDRPEIALHPLDLSTNPSSSATSESCIGIIQSYPDTSQVAGIADVILGVPFMRSTYTVMAFDVPDSSGNFPNASTSPLVTVNSRPRLGLLGLTDPTVALDEFHTVRVLQQPLPKGTQAKSGSGSSSTASGSTSSSGGKKLSVGVEVLIGIIGFFVLCFSLFALRWFYSRRKYQRAGTGCGSADGSVKDGKSLDGGVNGEVVGQDMIYQLARRRSKSDPYGPSEDTLRALRYSEYVRKRELAGSSLYTDDSAKTKVG